MKVLLLDPQGTCGIRPQEIETACSFEEMKVVTDVAADGGLSGSPDVDAILAGVGSGGWAQTVGPLLAWRTHPHTCLVPCWITADEKSFGHVCLWPRLAIDCFDPNPGAEPFCRWLAGVAEWQQSRMNFQNSSTLSRHSAMELAMALALRKATGRLLVLDEDGGEGSLYLRDGWLVDAAARHFRGREAFFDLLSWSRAAAYLWEPKASIPAGEAEPKPLQLLLEEGLALFREANLLFHFLSNLDQAVSRTESESALDDGGIVYYAEQKKIFGLIDGRVSAAEVVMASPLSRPRTMSCLAKWFSLGDIAAAGPAGSEASRSMVSSRESKQCVASVASAAEPAPAPRRLLIVDDSRLMCNALQEIFSKDMRFEIVGVAHDGIEALDLIERLKPDVVTLDMQMPRMDGLTALKHIMIRDPKPVVVLSAFTGETSQLTYASFKYGAVDVYTKPSQVDSRSLDREAEDLRNRVAQASCVRMEAAQYVRRGPRNSKPAGIVHRPSGGGSRPHPHDPCLVTINCGTGGFPALLKLFFAFPKSGRFSSTVACIAMPERVVEALVPALDKDCPMNLEVLKPEMALEPGVCYLCSLERTYSLLAEDHTVRVRQNESGPKGGRPFDQLLSSAIHSFRNRVIAVLISGDGDDGLEGMRRVRMQGGRSLVLSPDLCLRPELPRKALEQGCADEVKTVAELARMLTAAAL